MTSPTRSTRRGTVRSETRGSEPTDPAPQPSARRARRAVLRATAGLCVGTWLARTWAPVAAQDQPITIDRDVGDLVVLPARPDATVTGRSTFQQNTDFLVRVFSQDTPAFEREVETVVTDDGTWTATVDLSAAVDDQPITVEAVFNGDSVASAGGVVGPLSASVRFDDQRLPADGREVVITGTRLEVGGYVVVTDGPDGPILGVTGFLDGGELHSEVPVALDAPLEGSGQLVATAWLDVDGDRSFDPTIDRPYPDGNPVSDTAVVEAATPVPVTSPPVTDTPAPPPSGEGMDVVVSAASGALGVLGLRRAGARVVRSVRNRRDDGNRPPVAQFLYLPERPRPGIPVLFDGSVSFDPDPDDSVQRYEWSIGDTAVRGPRRVHVFGTPGEHEVELSVEDEAGVEGRRAETVSVETRAGRLELAAVSPGVESADPRDESLLFRNAGDADLDLGGWSVHDATDATGGPTPGSQTYTFPDRFTLPEGDSLSVHTGSAPAGGDDPGPADHHLYWDSMEPIWDGRSDCLVVCDADDNPVFGAQYDLTDGDEYDIRQVEPANLEDWFEPASVRETVRIPILDVTVGPRIGTAAIRNGIDFVASCLFLRGSGAFASAWAQITAFLALFLFTWLLTTGSGLFRPSIDIAGPIVALLGTIAVTTVGGIVAAIGRLYRWIVGRLS